MRLVLIFWAVFSRNDRTNVFNTKNRIIFDSFKNHIKFKLSQTNQNNKIYNSKNCNRIEFIHTILKFHTRN